MRAKTEEPPLELTYYQAATAAGVSTDLVAKWVERKMLVLRKGRGKVRYIDEPAFLALLLLKLLRDQDAPTESIRPLSVFLSTRTRVQLEREIEAGRTIMFTAAGRVSFARPDGFVKNDTGAATMLLAVDLRALLQQAARRLDKLNRDTEHHRN